MYYSNDKPTPTKFRQRTYAIVCDATLTDVDFTQHYSNEIRRANAQWSDCKFYVAAMSKSEERVCEFLRKELGVSPARITLFHLNNQVPVNKYRNLMQGFDSRLELEKAIVLQSSHDILWTPPDVMEGFSERVVNKRKEKQKTNPFIETMPSQ